MACFHPIRAWRLASGAVVLGRERKEQNGDSTHLRLPCGGCLGCRQDRAREWALRCHLENQQHRHAIFTTLTYDDEALPEFGSLERTDLQLWLKRLRKASGPARPLRFFACGEYGEKNHRPHYHAIVFGLDAETGHRLVDQTWPFGITKTVTVTPAAIAYVAGYSAKKLGWKLDRRTITDPETGELLYHWEPPFIQMSRRPGIGAHAKQWPQSWRDHAVHNGRKIPVPRFLHEAWKAQASPIDMEELERERLERQSKRETSKQRRQAAELVAIARMNLQSARRHL